MAMGEIETDNGAVVRLEADASPFMAALDKAREHTQGWAGKIQSAVSSIADFSTQKLASWSDKTKAVAGLTSEQVGQAIGGGIGAGVGFWFGGPLGAGIGAQVGALIGDRVGSNLDLSPIANKTSELFEALKPLADEVGASMDIVKNDVMDTSKSIVEAWSEVSLKDVWKGLVDGNQEALDKLKGAWETTTTEITGFFARSLDRLREMIDKIWGAIREPVAVVAGFVQSLLEKIGLVDQGTQDWGESVRSVEDAGRNAIGGLAYGLGYLEGLLKKAGGYWGEYVVAPMMSGFTELVKFLSDLAAVAADASKPIIETLASALGYMEGMLKKFAGYVYEYVIIPITKGLAAAFETLGNLASSLANLLPDSLSGPVKGIADQLKGAAKGVNDSQQMMINKARELQNTDASKLAKERAAAVGDTVGDVLRSASKGLDAAAESLKKQQLELLEKSREYQKLNPADQANLRRQMGLDLLDRGAEERAKRDRRTGEPEPEPTPEAGPADPLAGVTALVAASREANNAILRASGLQQDNAADRAAAAAEANVAKQEQVAANINQMDVNNSARHRDLIDQFERLNKNLEDAAVIKAV